MIARCLELRYVSIGQGSWAECNLRGIGVQMMLVANPARIAYFQASVLGSGYERCVVALVLLCGAVPLQVYRRVVVKIVMSSL